MPSEDFANAIARFRDDGKRQLLLAIGGPDGHDASLRARADLVLALGAMTWPHQIVRILVAEQLYRATTILSGHPYHRV
jgi:23S rRNA (pseudouridine1915-N3)-methyltransferase